MRHSSYNILNRDQPDTKSILSQNLIFGFFCRFFKCLNFQEIHCSINPYWQIPENSYRNFSKFQFSGSCQKDFFSQSTSLNHHFHRPNGFLMTHFRNDDLLSRISRSRNHPNTLNFMGTKLKVKQEPVCEGFLCLF